MSKVLFQILQFSLSTVSMSKTVLIQTIQFSISTQIKVKIVLFQAIQISVSTQFSSIWPIARTLSGNTTVGLRGPKSDGNEEVLCIPQSSCITETSPSECLLSYPGYLLGCSYPLPHKQCILDPKQRYLKMITFLQILFTIYNIYSYYLHMS